MKRPRRNKIIPLITCLLMCATMPEIITAAGTSKTAPVTAPVAETMTSAKRLEWFHEAKFGLFIHWGLYAIPAGEWKGRPIPGIGEWIMHRAQIPVKDYEKLAQKFNPKKFDATAWVKIAKDAGMKYIVITSKHHDGFALFDSKVSKYDVVDATPFERDIIKELSAACAKEGIKLGFYYSQAQDWHESNGAGNTWDFGPDEKKDFDQYLRDKAEPQIREILTDYGPVCLIWFDTPRLMNEERAQRLANIVRTLQPACLIDGRLGSEGDYKSTGDNAIPDLPMDGAWETPATINNTWGFKKDDDDWKSPSDVVFKLVDIVSKGGNYLLNVGPRSDGTIPPRSIDTLAAVGRWLQVNGAAIYGAGRSPFGEEFGDHAATLKTRDGKPVFLTRNDWRCTTQTGRLYFTLFEWPRGGFDLPRFKNKIVRATLLADSTRAPLEMKTAADGTINLTLPRPSMQAFGNVICVEIEGEKVER